VLRSTLEALNASEHGLLFVGSQGNGVLDDACVLTRRYWYRRSRFRLITLFTFFASQVLLYRALSRSTDIPRDAVIFVNTLLPFAAMLWGRRTGRRVVVHVHEVSITPGPLRRFLTSCAARTADLLLYVSNDHRSRLPIKGPPSLIVHNPVRPALAVRASEHIPRHDGQFRVLMLASPRGYKGIREYMALAKGLKDRTNVSFDLVLNAEPDEVAALAALHSDATNVTIHPQTNDPAYFYSRADLVLNLSRVDEWIETFGLTLAEAMTFGLPVIAPPIGGPAEIVTHGTDGYCIDSRDGAALREALLKLVDDPETYDAMARAARMRARDFTFESYSVALRDALHSLGKGRAQ
jgi:glycosyltransferase involved in cell wall biosynthesis